MTDAPLIGDFTNTPVNSARSPSVPRTAKPVAPVAPAVEAPAAAPSEEEAPQASTYEQGVLAAGLTMVQAREIMEAVLVGGQYEEVAKVGPVRVKLRTRLYQDTLRTLRYLELEKPTYAAGINDVIARYNVAASLVSYGDRVFAVTAPGAKEAELDAAFHERLTFLIGLPQVAAQRLVDEVYKFDERLRAVFAEGAPEDF